MKKYIAFTLLFLSNLMSAQNRQILETTSGDDLSQVVPTQIQYIFPEFTSGDVHFFRSPRVNGMLNYNMLVGEMQFVKNGHIQALANVENVILVNIDNRKFFPYRRNEFTEELLSIGTTHLRVRRVGKAVPHSRRGAFGTWSSTSAITTISTINHTDGRQHELSVTERIMVTVNSHYYLVGANGRHRQIRNVNAFVRQFPGHRAQIENFVREHNIRFNNEDDLKKLLKYSGMLVN